MEWHIAFEKIKPYLVRIETEDGHGTGFLFAFSKDHSLAAIATAAHVISHEAAWDKPIKLGHFDTRKVTFYPSHERVIWVDSSHDGATILVKSGSLPFPSAALPLLAADKVKKIGVEVGWVGFPGLCPHELCFFSGKISTYLNDDECYLIDGVAINGVSGGPVFYTLTDHTPEIIGTISAYMPNRQRADTLPGLLRAQDLTAAYKHIQTIDSFDAAKQQEKDSKKNAPEEPVPPERKESVEPPGRPNR